MYENPDHLTKESQQEQGSFYTPEKIAKLMSEKFDLHEEDLCDWSDFKILDPCVGKGSLLYTMISTYPWLKNDNLYGTDIDPIAIQYCIDMFPGGHFQVADCLENDLSDDDFWKKEPFESFNEYLKRNPKPFRKTFGRL